MKLIKHVFPYFMIFGFLSFTIITTLVGFQYTPNSGIYVVYNIAIAIVGYMVALYKLLVIRHKLNISTWVAMFAIFILVLSFVVLWLLEISATLAFDFWSYMLIWSIPAFLFGVVFSREKDLKTIWQGADVFMLILTIVICINAVFYYQHGRSSASVSGSATYQTMSYLSAFAFGLNYYLLVNQDNPYRLSLFQRSIFYKALCFCLLPIQMFSLIVTGGRGGMILAVAYFAFITCFVNKRANKNIKGLVILCSIGAACFLFMSSDVRIVNGLSRMLEFFGGEGINWSGTSGRDVIYEQALELIKAKPLFGYGVWGLYSYTRNPHNLFLELLLGGGICLLLVALAVFTVVLKKYMRMVRANHNHILILIFFFYEFVMLMFSGTYLSSPTVWYFVGFVLQYRIENNAR